MSAWWILGGGETQGFRVVRLEDESDPQDRKAYREKITYRIKTIETRPKESDDPGHRTGTYRVRGEISNHGNRSLDEVELTVYRLDSKGKPQLTQGGRESPTFSKCFPVLVNSYHPGLHAKALRPGESRPFVVDIPKYSGGLYSVDPASIGARVSALLFSER